MNLNPRCNTTTLATVPASGPFTGVKIIELSAIGPAPFCGMLLADIGAKLLRIEPPAARDAAMPIPDHLDPIWRGRSRLTLDLKKAKSSALSPRSL